LRMHFKDQIDQFLMAHPSQIIVGHFNLILPNLAFFEEGVSRYLDKLENMFYVYRWRGKARTFPYALSSPWMGIGVAGISRSKNYKRKDHAHGLEPENGPER
jgi:hypothetical protein